MNPEEILNTADKAFLKRLGTGRDRKEVLKLIEKAILLTCNTGKQEFTKEG